MRMPTLAARILTLGDSSFLCNPDVGLVICQLSPPEADENCFKNTQHPHKTDSNRMVYDAVESTQKDLL